MRIDGETHSLDKTPTIDRRRKHAVEVVVDRIVVRPDARSRIAGSIENALALGKGVVHVAHPDDDVPEPRWPVRVHSQHLACEKCGRSFDTLNPHNFSFNSSLGWCPACEGLGHANRGEPGRAAARSESDAGQGCAAGVAGCEPGDVAADAGGAFGAHRRADRCAVQRSLAAAEAHGAVWHGRGVDRRLCGARRKPARGRQRRESKTTARRRCFRFQFKGLYPALEEASKLSPRLRALLEQFVGEIDCSECGGSRLRDDAAAVRFRERTLDQIGRTPLGELLAQVKKWKLAANEKKVPAS